MQGLRDIAPVSKELPKEGGGESRHRLPVTDMAWSQRKGQQLSLIIHNEMQFEAIEPAHRRLASGRPARKNPVRENPTVMTDCQGGESMKAMPVQRPFRVCR